MMETETMGATAFAMVPVEERGLRGLELAEQMFTPAQRQQVAALLAVPAESPALMPFLALCIAEGFSPWANHVWLIPKKVTHPAANGAEAWTETKHLPAVGRDGLLHKARQSIRTPGGFRGMSYGVVCERDTFEVEFSGDETNDPKVLHRYASKPTEFGPDESPDRYRGRVIGAWAKLRLDGQPPHFYFASLREHGRLRHVWEWSDEARKRKPLYHAPGGGVTFAAMTKMEGGGLVQNRPVQEWEGAWDYVSTMILKCAQSYVCRIGLGVTGFVPVDELRSPEEWTDTAANAAAVVADAVEEFDFDALDADDDLRERLRRAVETANAQEAFAWGPAKCEMVLKGRTADELAALVEQIESENDLREQRIAKRSAPAEPIVEAEVVPEKPDASPDAAPPAGDVDRIGLLRAQLADLQARRHAATEEQQGEIVAEVDQIEAELKSLGAL